MAEVMVWDGTWTFAGELVRIVPGRDRRVHHLRRALGELAVPLTAIAGVAFESGRRAGRLRLRLRDGADPFVQVAGGKLSNDADPYRLTIDRDTSAERQSTSSTRSATPSWSSRCRPDRPTSTFCAAPLCR